ncbi:MAG TPA: NUDIX domain-containing protein [Roseiarcus sp.]|nr:NUDIX domain-containing protein [Roseiarcus sp.]
MTDRPTSLPQWVRSRLFHLFFVASRPMTLGVRAAVFDAEGRVFLVRHTYVPGWHFPGGGVERGETALDALTRELKEEGNIAVEEEPRLHGLFFNRAVSPRDHVALYIVRRYAQSAPRRANYEIAETGFFARDALPEGTSRATRARLHEILDGAVLARTW